MYSINDTVLYGSDGVCNIVGRIEKQMYGRCREYFILKPVFNDSTTIFTPVDSPALKTKMRSVLSVDEIYELIKAMPDENANWIDDDRERREHYSKLLAEGNRQDLVCLIKTLYLRSQELKQSGKKIHATDEKILKDAEKQLYEEFAHVLNIQRDEVVPFIIHEIDIMGGSPWRDLT